jgi:hypothetical protein
MLGMTPKPKSEIGQYAWHVHHEILFEPLSAPLQERIDFINRSKEVGQRALRLKLLRLVKDQKTLKRLAESKGGSAKLWRQFDDAIDAASKAYVDANAHTPAYERASETAETTVLTLQREATDRVQQIDALHRQECEPDCPWNGKTIFSKAV